MRRGKYVRLARIPARGNDRHAYRYFDWGNAVGGGFAQLQAHKLCDGVYYRAFRVRISRVVFCGSARAAQIPFGVFAYKLLYLFRMRDSRRKKDAGVRFLLRYGHGHRLYHRRLFFARFHAHGRGKRRHTGHLRYEARNTLAGRTYAFPQCGQV